MRLGDRLAALASEHGVPLAANTPGWYGLDPIHVRRPYRRLFWQRLLGGQVLYSHIRPALGRLRLAPPERRTWLGLVQRRSQPAARLQDGTTLAFY